jgi:hypothetical protein
VTELEFMQRVLAVFAFDECDSLWWRFEEGRTGDREALTFFAQCSDVFYWGSADVEPITPETIWDLEHAFKDVKIAKDGDWDISEGTYLYCARRRQMRPQGAMYKYLDPKTHHLFDQCGPEREVGLGNPTHHPAAKPNPPINTSTSMPYTAEMTGGYIAPDQQ